MRRFFLPDRGVLTPYPYAVIAAAGLTAGLLAGPLWLTERVEWAWYDRVVQVATRAADPAPEIVIVAIDEPSFAEIRQPWPWPRRFHAALIEQLAAGGARRIVFDIVFDTASAAGDDPAFAEAIRAAGNVVLASDRTELADPAYDLQQWVDPIEPLADAAQAVGAATITFDPDGVVRRAALMVGGRPALATAAAGTDASGAAEERLIRFRGRPRHGIATVSYYQALEPGLLPPDLFRDKTVFVGRSLSTAAALDAPDHVRTPVAVRTPAVELHASVLAMLHRGEFVRDPFAALPAFLVWCAAVGIAAAFISYRLDPPGGLAVLAGGAGLMLVASYGWFAWGGTRVPVVGPLVTATSVFAATAVYRYALGRRERQLIKRAFQHYVAPAIVERMLDDPSRLRLGGEVYDATILFTDLEDFTSAAEGLAPAELRAQVSEYFKAMMDELLTEQATLDKFTGDGIMVYFGCPIADDTHPLRACRAALAMQRRLAALNRHAGRSWRMRIGINTGTVVAGNMGTDTIFNFTVLGDCVNLASRLEGANKEYGSAILAGESTWLRARDAFRWRELDRIRVKGASRPMSVYELLGDSATLSDARQDSAQRYEQALALYRARRWDDAARCLREAQAIDPSDAPVGALLARCRAYARQPPAPEWDGVHTFTIK